MSTPRILWPAPVPMDPAEAEQELERLQADYAGWWHIFRSRHSDGRPWWWYGSIRHPAAGVSQTVAAPGPDELREVFARERRAAERDRPLL
jgi:hypothetical protein